MNVITLGLQALSTSWLGIVAATVGFFVLGSLWFSALFSSLWKKELAQHNIFIQEPPKNMLFQKMVLTLISNALIVCSIALLVRLINPSDLASGLFLGLLLAIGIAAPTIAMIFLWENRSVSLFLIDAGYPILGIILTTLFFSLF